MLKKIGLSAAALVLGLVMLAPTPASARVRFGVTIGTAPYAYPVDPYYNGGYYVDPYANPYPYTYSYPAPVYTYPAPAYVAPYYSFGWGGGHERHEWMEHERHERHEFREHGGGWGHGGWRR